MAIKILDAKDIDSSFYESRDFGESLDIVKTILKDVKTSGDKALKEYGAKFDVSSPSSLEISQEELKKAAEKVEKSNPELFKALKLSHDLAFKFASKQRESFDDFEMELSPGLFTGQKNIPVDCAGAYVPAGRFPLLSSVIMTLTPAAAAGVKKIVLCTPPRVHPDDMEKAKLSGLGVPGKPFVNGKPYADEGIMAAAYICGVTQIFACGGAQAIAAMTYGTESIPCTNVIVGPGNKFVAEAKRLAYGTVGIDMLAGPTEVFIIADKTANPAWVAADMLAQAEHDIVAQPVMVTDYRDLAQKVADEISKQLEVLPTKAIAEESVNAFGKIIITQSLEDAAAIANKKAPEHLELAMADGDERNKIQSLVHNYGSLFIGHGAAEVLGDYAAGLNHTLPTSGSARFTGGLSVRCFIKTVTTLRTTEGASGVVESAKAAELLGIAEGLIGHSRAAKARL